MTARRKLAVWLAVTAGAGLLAFWNCYALLILFATVGCELLGRTR